MSLTFENRPSANACKGVAPAKERLKFKRCHPLWFFATKLGCCLTLKLPAFLFGGLDAFSFG
jgi:hypothetical protein